MTAEAVFVRTWSVGAREVTLSVPRPQPGKALRAWAEWSPSPPAQMSPEEWAQYRRGRDAALAELSGELGINAAVIDL